MTAWSAFPWSGNTSVRLNHTPVGWKPRSFSGIFVPVNGSRTAQRRQAMLTSSKLALCLVFVLRAAWAGRPPPKQPVRPNTAIHHQVPAGSHLSLDSASSIGSARPAGSVDKPSDISPQGYERLKRLMENFEDVGS